MLFFPHHLPVNCPVSHISRISRAAIISFRILFLPPSNVPRIISPPQLRHGLALKTPLIIHIPGNERIGNKRLAKKGRIFRDLSRQSQASSSPLIAHSSPFQVPRHSLTLAYGYQSYMAHRRHERIFHVGRQFFSLR
jgi:hypothetical protein